VPPDIDGLRGIAAFVVVWHHSSLLYFSWAIHHPWNEHETKVFVQLPIIRLFLAGLPAVCIFFVISGYAISLRLLKLSHLGRSTEFAHSLASSLFRRHPRLFMPATFVLLMSAIMSYLGLFPTESWSKAVAQGTRVPPHPDTFYGQLSDWAKHSMSLAYPIRNTINSRDINPYDPNLWTLPVEFGTSMMVFTLLAVTHRFRPFVRMAFNFILVAYFFYRTETNVFLFLCGMSLADIRTYLTLRNEARSELPRRSDDIDDDDNGIRRKKPRRYIFGNRWAQFYHSSLTRRIAAIFGVLFCMYALSIPEFGKTLGEDPFFKPLLGLVPHFYRATHFWIPLGAVGLVAIVDYNSFLQAVFNSRVAQYLGKISFALYLIHGPLIWSYGAWLAPHFIPTAEDVSTARYGFGVALCYLLWWPVAIYEADLVTRLVDVKSVAFARWVYNKLIVSS